MQSARSPHVLLVDDCAVQRLLGTTLLACWRITPVLASNGIEAVALAGEQHFDIILMDLDMPVLDGFRATQTIRRQERTVARRRRVPVVAYTANPSAMSEACWPRSGLDAVLAKPSVAAEMEECLRRWCPDRAVVGR